MEGELSKIVERAEMIEFLRAAAADATIVLCVLSVPEPERELLQVRRSQGARMDRSIYLLAAAQHDLLANAIVGHDAD